MLHYQGIRFHGAGWSLLVRPLLAGLTGAAGADAGGRQVEQLCLVLLGRRPRQGASNPLHWVLPYRFLAVDLKCHNIYCITKMVKLERNNSCERVSHQPFVWNNLKLAGDHFLDLLAVVSYLDAVLGPLLQVRNNRVVPKVNEPRSKLIHRDRTGQEKARAWGDKGGEGRTLRTHNVTSFTLRFSIFPMK